MGAKQKDDKSVEVLKSEVQGLRTAVEQLSALNELARLVGTAQDLDSLNRRLVRHSLRMIGAEQGVVTLVDTDNLTSMSTLLRTRVSHQDLQEFRPNDLVLGWMGINKKPLRINDVSQAKAFDPEGWHPDIRSVLCVPMLIKTRLLGLLTLFNKNTGNGFDEADERLLFIIAMQSAQVIENQRLLHTRNQELEEQVAEKTAVLQRKNAELEKIVSDLQRTQQQLIHQEKLASLGQLTAGIAHEIKNPLNFVNNFASLISELLEDLRSNPDARIRDVEELIGTIQMNAEKINEHGRRADRIVRSMMKHASGATGARQKVNLNAMVEEYINLAHHGWHSRDRLQLVANLTPKIIQDYDERVGEVEIVPQEIGQVLVNLCNNAFDAMMEKKASQEGDYDAELKVSTKRKEGMVEIRIEDNGLGIARGTRDRLFEPFFTTKSAGSGTGLGLSLSHDIVVKGHGGRLEVMSEEGKGATFIVRLPA